MDANTLRLILIVVGVILILALYLWERKQASRDAEDDDVADDSVHWGSRHEQNLPAWQDSDFPETTEDARDWAEPASRLGPLPDLDPDLAPDSDPAPGPAPGPAPEPEPNLDEPLIVQLSINAPPGGELDGPAIVHAASTCGLEPGEMDVFHCYLGDESAQQTLFRVANLVKPGTFPFGAMETFTTPGLILFASLEGSDGDLAVVEELIGTARCLAEELDAELRDETRAPFTPEKEGTLRDRVLARMVARDAEVDGP